MGTVMAQTSTDPETIRKWAEKHGGKPAAVRRTHQGGDVGIIRIMFPNAPQSEHDELVEITLALLYEPDGLFKKIVGRDTAEGRERGDHSVARH